MANINEFTIKAMRAERFLRFVKVEMGPNDLIHPGQVGTIFARDVTLNTDNGVGKTTWMRLQFYTIFGKDIYGVKADELSNDEIDGGHFTEVVFTSKGNDYLVQRFNNWVPYSGGPAMEASEKKTRQSGVRFYLIKGHDMHPLRGGTDKETQKMIDDIVGFSSETAKTIFMTAQGEKSPLLEANAAKTQEVLMELFPLEFVDLAHEKVDKLAKEQKKVVEEIDRSLSRLNETLSGKEADALKYEALSHEFAQGVKKKVEDLHAKFLTLKAKKTEMDNQISQAGISQEVIAEYHQLREELVAMAKASDNGLAEQLSAKQEEWTEVNTSVNKLKDSVRVLESDQKALMSAIVLSDKQALTESLAKVSSEIELNPEKIKSAEARRNEIDGLIKVNTDAFAEISSLRAKINSANTKLSEMKSKRSNIAELVVEDVAALKSELNTLMVQNQVARNERAQLSKFLTEVESELSKVEHLLEGVNIDEVDSSVFAVELEGTIEKISSKKHDHGLKKAMVTLQQGEVEKISKETKEGVESCPYCDRPFGEHEHSNQQSAKERAEKAVAELEASKVELESLASELVVLQSTAASLEKHLEEAKSIEKAIDLKLTVTGAKDRFNAIKSDEESEKSLSVRIQDSTEANEYQTLLKEVSLSAEAVDKIVYDPDLLQKLTVEKHELSAVRSMASLEEEKNSLVSKLEKLSKQEESERVMSAELAKAQSQLASKELELVTIVDEGKKLKQTLKEQQDLKTQRTAVIDKRLGELQPKIEAVTTLEEAIRKTMQEMVEVDKNATQIKSEKDPYAELMKAVSEDISSLQVRIKDVKERMFEAELELEKYEFWLEGFGRKGIKAFVYDDTIKVLNERIQNNLRKFGFDGVMSLEFVPEAVLANGTTKNEIRKIFRLNGREKPWHSFSGGQKARFIFATNMAVRRVAADRIGIKFNNPGFDEPFDGLCSQSQQIAMRLLMDMAKDHSGVKIITHDTGLQSLCNTAQYLLKKGHYSYKVSRETFENPTGFNPTPPARVEEKIRKKKAGNTVESDHDEGMAG